MNMNIKSKFLLPVVVPLMIVAGCSREQPETNAASTSDVRAEDRAEKAKPRAGRANLSDDAVLIRCGTNTLTRAEANQMIDLRVKMAQLSLPKGQNLQLRDALAARVLAAVPYGFPRDCAIREFAATNGIAAGRNEIELMRSRAMKSAKQDFSSWPSFVRKLSANERATLNERIQIEALTESVRVWHAANRPAKVTDEEIARFRQRQRNYNKMAAATNDFTFAQATNVWQALERGELAFGEAVRKYSTDEANTDDGVWGDFAQDYFNDNPVLAETLSRMEPGNISPPVEGDNGLMILRVDDKQVESDGRAVYSLSRIFFHLPEFYPELDDAAFAKEIREARQNRLFNEFIADLATKNPPTYPSGEKIFEDAKRTAAQPALF